MLGGNGNPVLSRVEEELERAHATALFRKAEVHVKAATRLVLKQRLAIVTHVFHVRYYTVTVL